MSPKFWFRTLRNLGLRRKPYFAHLAITHRCNLRCHFCHIPEWKVKEQGLAGMKRIIDRLDRMGVAVLSISGGGEPLLRADFAQIINYAVAKGMQTKITSNGTMSEGKYTELLASRIHEIGISLDGVEGNEIPFAHVGPKILQSIRFLNDHLPKGKHLTLNITVSASNINQVDNIIAYCTREFPKARLWLNPVVVGEGQLRVLNEPKVDPHFLYSVDSPTLLTPRFYKDACVAYYKQNSYNWDCLAGDLFFDIKPDGTFWICQDHPAKEPLNILDREFERKYRKADFSHRRECRGCTYSCYYMTQKAFEPRHWKEMASIYWWKLNTDPSEPCRKTAETRSWIWAGLHYATSRLFAATERSAAKAEPSGERGLSTTVAGIVCLAVLTLLSRAPMMQAQVRAETAPQVQTAIEPNQILERMELRNAAQQAALQSARQHRRYHAENRRLNKEASLLVEYQYVAPNQKMFRVIERSGSGSVQKRVFDPMLKAEGDTGAAAARQAAEINRRNYSFRFLGLGPERTGLPVCSGAAQLKPIPVSRQAVDRLRRVCRAEDRGRTGTAAVVLGPQDAFRPPIRKIRAILVPLEQPNRGRVAPPGAIAIQHRVLQAPMARAHRCRDAAADADSNVDDPASAADPREGRLEVMP
jgi:MoaA/NifB/PqqE/SkfB family radical SAM enzyme